MKESLTKREKEILKYIEKVIDEQGYPPSVREIGEAVGFSSTATVYYYLIQLEQKQYIQRKEKKGRGLKILKDEYGNDLDEQYQEIKNIPILNSETLEDLNITDENIIDFFPLPADVVGEGETFMVMSKDDSMKNVGILTDDYILIKRQNKAQNGQIVLVTLEKDIVIRSYVSKNNEKYLKTENGEDEKVSNNFNILGLVIRIFRKV